MSSVEGIAKVKLHVRPCPFCGTVPFMEPWHGGKPSKRMIHCTADDCYVSPKVTGENPSEAARKWNARSAATNEVLIEG